MCAVGRHQQWRERRRRSRGCEQNAVQPGADVGGEKEKTEMEWRVAGCIQ